MFSVQQDFTAIIEDFALGSLPANGPAIDWSKGMVGSMQVGGGSQVRGFVNCVALAGTTKSVTCKIETSPDGVTWDDGTTALTAITAAATAESKNFAAPFTKPLKFIRLVITAIGNTDNTGELQWGLF